jgi:predicted alpha/beta-hydrolase family hydrolase
MLNSMDMIIDGDHGAERTFIFAHGAGGAMDTPFMNVVARGLADRGIRVARFEFPYMAARRKGKKSGAPDREPILLDAWRQAIDQMGGGPEVSIGGKSLGGRMASMVADEKEVRGLVCFGYPFHPPGAPEKMRTKHLMSLKTPALIIQGTRDAFGGPEDVKGYRLPKTIRVEWLQDGDHSYKPRAASGITLDEQLQRAIDLAAKFILS